MADNPREEWRIVKKTAEDGSDLFVVQKGEMILSSSTKPFWIYVKTFRSFDKAMDHVRANRIVSEDIVYDSSDNPIPIEE